MSSGKSIRDIIRKLTPGFMLSAYRKQKKQAVNKNLEAQKAAGKGHSLESLSSQLAEMGIRHGDTLLVHSALSKMGYVEGGPAALVKALLNAVGDSGNLLMPSSPNPARQLDYIRANSTFDVNQTPSKMGAVTEYFRRMEGVQRSLHPTEPVCAFGPLAEYFVSGHFNEPTPYTANSPWYRVAEKGGKILYAGVTLDNAGTNLHTMEDAVDFPYPVYTEEKFKVNIIDSDGTSHEVETVVHNPVMSDKRRCDELLPMFGREGAMQRVKLGDAECLLFDAKRMFDVMVEQFNSNGVTMYTPHGGDLKR